MTEPTDDLQQRCAEVVEWQRTGVLPGNALRDYAAVAPYSSQTNALQMAERDTAAQAMELVAKWGTPQAVAGEPVAWQYQSGDGLWHNFIDARHYKNTVDSGEWPIRALYTTPRPTQAQAGAVPLTPEQIAEGFAKRSRHIGLFAGGVRFAEQHHGIKGGQHGAAT